MTNTTNSARLYTVQVTEAQKEFLEFCKEIKFGVLKEVIIQKGEPVRSKEAVKERQFGK